MSIPTNSAPTGTTNSASTGIISFSITTISFYTPLTVSTSNSIVASDATSPLPTALTPMPTPTSSSSTVLVPSMITPSPGQLSSSTPVFPMTAPSQIASSTSPPLDELSLAPFRLNEKRVFSFEEIFDYIKNQPKEEQWGLTETLLQFRIKIVRQFERFDAKILGKIEEKAWEYVGLDKITVNKQLESLRRSVNWAKAETNREVKNRKQIQDCWGSEVLSLFESCSRFKLIEVIKVV